MRMSMTQIGRSNLALVIFIGLTSPLAAQDAGAGWGNLTSTSTTTAASHNDDATTAIVVQQGRAALLPGASISSIGVMNNINVVGDNNILTSTQEGSNSGSVTSTINVNE